MEFQRERKREQSEEEIEENIKKLGKEVFWHLRTERDNPSSFRDAQRSRI